jgi:hypothetical protein
LECDAAGNIRFDHTGDHIRAWRLCGNDHVNAGRASHLRNTRDRRLDVRRRCLHEISEFIDDHNDVWNSVGDLLFCSRGR